MKKLILLLTLFLFSCSSNQGTQQFTVNDALIGAPLASRAICYFTSGKDLNKIKLVKSAVSLIRVRVNNEQITDPSSMYQGLVGLDLILAQTLHDSIKWIMDKLTQEYTNNDAKAIMLVTINGCEEGLNAKISEIERKQNEPNS